MLYEDTACTYGRLWRDVEAAAAAVQHQPEFQAGAHVGLLGENDPAYVTAYLAIMLAGAVVVPLNPRSRTEELGAQLDFVDASLCLVHDSAAAHAEGLAGSHVVRRFGEIGNHGNVVRGRPAPGDRAMIALTSGTTGTPKGVVHTLGSLTHATLGLLRALPFAHDDISVAFLPFYASAPEHVLPALMSGGTLRVIPRFDPEIVIEACEHATAFASVPTIVSRLLETSRNESLGRLRWMSFASEPMPPEVLARWWREFPNVATYQYYGMTEILPITHATPAAQAEAPGTVGVAYPTSEVRIVDPELQPVAIGRDGEVVCASPARMAEYLGDRAATKAALTPDGAIRTGDLGRLDESGRLFLTGRLKDIIISGGLNVAPAEIESVALSHPGVATAAVVGIPDERWGETPVVVAVATREATLTPGEILSYCGARLSGYKRPSAAAVVADLPVTGIGKSAKSEIRRAIMAGEIPVVSRSDLSAAELGRQALTA